jgi:hypothetical protein
VGHEKGYFGHLALARLAAGGARSSVGFCVEFRTLEKKFNVLTTLARFEKTNSQLPDAVYHMFSHPQLERRNASNFR